MVVVLSTFRVANGMEQDVERAFRERPRSVEQAQGFLWLEVFVDAADPAVFHLLTRWTDLQSYETWHRSPAHRDSHAFIPAGLKLDPRWTTIHRMTRIAGTTGPSLTEAVADATLLFAAYTAASKALHLFVVSTHGTVRACNTAACESLRPGGALAGESLYDYMPDADAARLRHRLAQPHRDDIPTLLNFAAPGGAPFSLECWIHVHGDYATLLGQPTFRRDQQLQNELMVMNQELALLSRERSREVRDERNAREVAERVNLERSAFLTVLGHELRQPIGSALAAVGVLRKINPDPTLERTRALLERQLNQMQRLVEDLSDTARVTASAIQLRRSNVDLLQQLRDLSTVWQSVAEDQRKSFVSSVPHGSMMLWADADRLQQVLSNVVGNAFKYTPPGGRVSVTVQREHDFATVIVQDEGEGIPAERLPHIFELFQRATSSASGLGVGLAVVNALVRAHGGTVAAASDGLGRGTTITVRLPLAHSGLTEGQPTSPL